MDPRSLEGSRASEGWWGWVPGYQVAELPWGQMHHCLLQPGNPGLTVTLRTLVGQSQVVSQAPDKVGTCPGELCYCCWLKATFSPDSDQIGSARPAPCREAECLFGLVEEP